MTAYNVVRFKVKSGMEKEFLTAHAPGKIYWPGLRQGTMIETGPGAYCLIGEWPDASALKQAMPHMLATLDTVRHMLVPGPSGVTDAVSGPAVVSFG